MMARVEDLGKISPTHFMYILFVNENNIVGRPIITLSKTPHFIS
jgi:hypothetical protein